MKDKELKRSNRFLITEIIICAVIVYFNMASKYTIVSNTFTISFMILAAFFFYKVSKDDVKYQLYTSVLLIPVVSLFCILINGFKGTSYINFTNMKNYLMFCSTTIYLFLMANIETDKKTAERVLKLNILIAAFYPLAYKYFPQNTTHMDLTLNFSNPNLLGMWILQSLLYLSLAFLMIKNKFYKLLSLALFAYDFYLMMESGARNCLIALLLFFALCAWIMLKQNSKFSKMLIGIINVIPITFIFVYLKFIDIVKDSGKLDFMVSEGKSLTSRVEIWERNLKKIEDCWLIGSYFTAGGNTHNAHLVVLGSFGLITLIFTIYFTYKICCIVNDTCRSKKSLCCLAAFFAVIFMGMGEGALYSGAMGIYILASTYIYIARAYDEENYVIEGYKNDGIDHSQNQRNSA